MVNRVLERFQAAGLIVKEWNSVKLHGTVMNTLFRKDPDGKHSQSYGTVHEKGLEGHQVAWTD